ncbi:MAG: hypothetical protein U0175_11805 [Caldilineaceae bacterium]
MILGQFVQAEVEEGATNSYKLPLEGGGNYLLFSQDEEQAANFSFAVTNSKGEDIASGDEFAKTELALDPDEYTVTFTATASATLSAVVVGDFGQLSDDSEQPGALFNGSYLQLEKIDATQYAKLTLPETDYYQQAHIWLVGAEGDSYDIQVSNDTVYEFGSSSDEEEAGLKFWTRGGEFDVELSPSSGGESLSLMVLLSGPAPLLEKGTPIQVTVGDDQPNHIFAIDVENAGAIVTVQVTPASESSSYQLTAALKPETDLESLFIYGQPATMRFLAPYAGQYILQLSNTDAADDFTVVAEEGDVAPELPLNGKLWGTVKVGEDVIYQMKLEEAGQFLSLILLGSSEDIDLEASLVDEEGNIVHNLSLYGTDAMSELLSQSNAQAGLYEVRVNNQYNEEDGKFVLTSRLENPLDFAGQWAVEATASSEYQSDGYTAMQATGEPNTPIAGDYPTAWASKEADGGDETLELSYEMPVSPLGIRIYETNAPGAVIKVEAFDAESEEWAVLWEGSDPTDAPLRIFSPELEQIDFATNRIRLTLDSANVSGWNEIDAVELLGVPQ